MTYSLHLLAIAATLGGTRSAASPPVRRDAEEALAPAWTALVQLVRDFAAAAASPAASFALEQQLRDRLRELGRVGLEWAYNHIEPEGVDALPSHVVFEAAPYTRLGRKTPQVVATLFGKVSLWRTGYRPTQRTGDPTLFPRAHQLGIVAGATPAVAERAAYDQSEAGATQRRTLRRLRDDHGLTWGVKTLRGVVERVAAGMAAGRHDEQVANVLELLEQAWVGTGPHKPVLSVGRDGISFGRPVRGGTVFEVATAVTVTVMNRRGRRLGTVYLAHTPESKQGTMSRNLTRLVTAVLQAWERPRPRLCYVTDAGDNEAAYDATVLRPMRHPRTGDRLAWVRVVDYYHASERLWAMAGALFGPGRQAQTWVRRMQTLLKRPNGIRRVLNSVSVHRSRQTRKGKRRTVFDKAYNYLLRKRTPFLRSAAYRRVGIPCGRGVTEAACKTIVTQRLKLSGMRWTKGGAQTILDLRVLNLSGVWAEAYQRLLGGVQSVHVPTYAAKVPDDLKIAA
ncbi:hypothetical protein [Fimbriiglobus ruber]|uniref:Mobile element protein n=1 Tax=Fimbriiglobus ruber TaxID=1908690 RepID=A0A225DTP9_9BACT|nr:hypothetical protein [Fimbriiglobus ruber]OWK41918.1 hypothetical protein FRUB_03996 [Fimbriiglobus ruber]